jgi:Fur family ferric uptake transcriptional regulator
MVSELVKAQSDMDGKMNRRSTEQRELILETIQGADKHLDADEIYQLVRQKSPSISLSTVYRSLQLFKELELVEEHQFDGTRRYYEITPHSKHQHMVCLVCGRVFEFECPSAERLRSKIGREKGFKVTDAEVRLLGYCPECQQRLATNATNSEEE